MAIDVTLMLLQILNMALLVVWIVLAMGAVATAQGRDVRHGTSDLDRGHFVNSPSWARSLFFIVRSASRRNQ